MYQKITKLSILLPAFLVVLFAVRAQPSPMISLKDAAKMVRADYLYPGGGLGLNFTGEGATVYVAEPGNGGAWVKHPKLNGRVTNILFSPANAPEGHATGMAGTICASELVTSQPASKDCRGLAYKCQVVLRPDRNDLFYPSSVPFDESNFPLLISNHSYAAETFSVGLLTGRYSQISQGVDATVIKKLKWLPVTAAGNNGGVNMILGNLTGWDQLDGGVTCAKNVLTVANAINVSIAPDGKLLGAKIEVGSSKGPTDDYRLKPEISAPGNNITMPWFNPSIPDFYRTDGGTSISSAVVSGSLILLQQYYKSLNNVYLNAATLKGLVLHTADDIAHIPSEVGPDARSGYGLLNMKAAAELIRDNGKTTLISENSLDNGTAHIYLVHTNGGRPIIASLSWQDKEGPATFLPINSHSPVLVNDLDIRVQRIYKTGTGTSFYPWRLTPESPMVAGKGDNYRDNYEKVEIPLLEVQGPGNYIIVITHKGNLTGASVPYSLLVTGIDYGCKSGICINSTAPLAETGPNTLPSCNGGESIYPLQYARMYKSKNKSMFENGSLKSTYNVVSINEECAGGNPWELQPGYYFIKNKGTVGELQAGNTPTVENSKLFMNGNPNDKSNNCIFYVYKNTDNSYSITNISTQQAVTSLEDQRNRQFYLSTEKTADVWNHKYIITATDYKRQGFYITSLGLYKDTRLSSFGPGFRVAFLPNSSSDSQVWIFEPATGVSMPRSLDPTTGSPTASTEQPEPLTKDNSPAVVRELRLYPNPTVGSVKVESGQYPIQGIRISSIKGEILQERSYTAETLVTLDLVGYLPGIYDVVVFTTDGKISHLKLVKQ